MYFDRGKVLLLLSIIGIGFVWLGNGLLFGIFNGLFGLLSVFFNEYWF